MHKHIGRKGLVVGIIVLFVGASVTPSITGYDKDVEKIDYILNENETLNMKNDDYNNLMKQVIENGVISRDNWLEQDKLLASDGAAGDHFGESVSIDRYYAIVGACLDDDNGSCSGSAYVFIRSGSTWIQQAKLLASDGAAGDEFGCSVSIDGDYAIVGASWDNDNGGGSGSAYVFIRSGTAWIQQAKLLASDGAAYDWFGCTVSIDGDYAIIGACYDDDNGGSSGSAYVFKRDGTAWTEQAKLLASDGAAGDRFGCSVSIDGDYAIVGATWDNDNGDNSGSAYVFIRSGTAWIQQAKLLASDGAADDGFGCSVSIDGDYAIVGATWDNDNGDNSGSAYVFIRSGTAWIQQAKLLASDGAASDMFGYSVSIDGDYAIVGAHYDGDNGHGSGSAYIFTRSGSTWIQQAKLLASDGAAGDKFGCSVSIDGDYAIVGAYQDDDNGGNSGSAYVFTKSGGNQPPVADAGGPYSGYVGTEILFDASGSYDPDGSIVGYQWDFDNDGTWDTGWLTDPTIGWYYDEEYHGQIKLEVCDNNGDTGTDTAQVDVLPSFGGPDWLECLLDKAGMVPTWMGDHWHVELSFGTNKYNCFYYIPGFDMSVPINVLMDAPLGGDYSSIGDFKITIYADIYPDDPVLNNILLNIPKTSHYFSLPFGGLTGRLIFSGTHALQDGSWDDEDIYFDVGLSANLLEIHFNTVIVIIPVTVELAVSVGAGVTVYINSPCDWTGDPLPGNVFDPQGHVDLIILTEAGVGFDFGRDIRASLGVYGQGSASWYYDHFTFVVNLGLYGEIWIYEGRWSLYEDSWSYNWEGFEKPSNIPTVDQHQNPGTIDIKNVDWQILPRNYGDPVWQNNTRGELVKEVFPFAKPDIDSDDGEKMLVWGFDDKTKDPADGLELKYSVWDGSQWSTPGFITNDTYLQIYPNVEYLDNGDAICVFNMLSECNVTDFDNFTEKIETGYSYWNHNTNTWTSPKIIEMTDEDMDFKPQIAHDGNKAVTVWSCDKDKDILTVNDTVVYASFWNGTTWHDTRKVVEGNIIADAISVAYKDGEAFIAYPIDEDGNLSTINDKDIFVKTFTSSENISTSQLTDDDFMDTFPSIKYQENNPIVAWIKQRGNLTALYYSEVGVGTNYLVTEGSISNPEIYYGGLNNTRPFIGWTDTESLTLRYSTFENGKWKTQSVFDFDRYVGDVAWDYSDLQLSAIFVEKDNISSSENCSMMYLYNSKPTTPQQPTGPQTGVINISYSYTSSTSDSDNDQIYYKFDWDDRTTTDWIGPFNTGQSVNKTHTWNNSGIYDVRIKAKDNYGIESNWSDTLIVNISGNTDAPNLPVNSSPNDNAENISLSTNLSCDVSDPNNDSMVVIFYWGIDSQESGCNSTFMNNSGTAEVQINNLESNTRYWWYAEADDGTYTTKSETWHFTTINRAPNSPSKPTGPTTGVITNVYTYSTSTTDPDNDNVYYQFEWDDNSITGWLGPYSSGETCNASHIWTDQGTYQIKVKARDTSGHESEWSEPLTVNMTDVLPEITNVMLTTSDPLDTEPGFGWENFTCTVTDNDEVDEVKLVLIGDIITEYPMTKSDDNYYCNLTIETADEYTYHIWANDTSDNEITSTPQPFNLSMNEDVDMNGQVYFEDLIAIVMMYGDTGPNGWVREDVDNNGHVYFDDLIAVVMEYGEWWWT